MSRRTPEQLEAGRDPARDVFLRAGAGTGKTTVLVDRFCSAALDPQVGVERILAFTFTERAADQLRRRVRAELTRLASEVEGEQREAILEAEERAERAWISTIHGFCRRLLAAHPAAAGIDPRFRVLEEPEAERLARGAFDAALEDRVQSGDPAALDLAAANHRRTLFGMVRGAHDELRSQGHRSPSLPDPPPTDPPARIAELIDAARSAREECSEASSAKGRRNLERMGRAIGLDPSVAVDTPLLEEIQSLRLDGGGKSFAGPGCERYKRALERARGAVAAEVMRDAYEQLRALLDAFGERYQQAKQERSALDFEDLQLETVALLQRNERLRERYRERFRQLMVDEFQDTNAVQLSLIEALRGPETRLFMVGDEFQSIYGFRHADIDVYRREHRRFVEGEEPNGVALPLTGNFRAQPDLVATTNAIGEALLADFEPLSAMVAAEPASGPIAELQLVLDKAKEWDSPDTVLPRLPDDPSSASKVAEARLLAARLRELVDDGEDPAEIVVLLRAFTHVAAFERALREAGLDPYVVGGRGFWSQQQIEDMRTLLAVVANPLDDEALFGALASPACGLLPDTLWLLRRAATSPPPQEGERERTLHVWPLVRDLLVQPGPDRLDAEAMAARGEAAARTVALIPEGEHARLLEFARRLQLLRERGAEGGLETLVERVATVFGYDLAVLVREEGAERWANVRKLMRLAREFEAREGPDLSGFLEYLDTRAGFGADREAEAATRAEGHAGVRVMTVHAVKGLEFGVVAVADLGRTLRFGWSPLRIKPGADGPDENGSTRVGMQLGRLGRPSARLHDFEELTELATAREAEEEGRLAYVAATRARRRLILSGTYTTSSLTKEPIERAPISGQLIRRLLDGDPGAREIELPAAVEGAPPARLAVRLLEPGPGVGAALLTPRAAAAPPAPATPADPPLARPPTPPPLSGQLSYSALALFDRCEYRFYVERVLGISATDRAPGDPRDADLEGEVSAAARRRYGPGVAIHSLLEWSARNRWLEPSADRVAAALREQGLEPGDESLVGRVGELVGAWLASPLRDELEDAELSPELPFVLSAGGALLRGSIDLLAERPGAPATIIDYKTDRLEGRAPAEAAAPYELQRDLYALAACERGPAVETVYVFLESPDDPVRQSFDEAGIAAARSRIESLIERLGLGRFEVTDRPHLALCHDCPARERLCSHQRAAQMRDEPEPPVEPPVRDGPLPGAAPPPASGKTERKTGTDAAEEAGAGAQLNLLGER